MQITKRDFLKKLGLGGASETRMMGAKQMKFCGAVARALLIGVE